MSRKYLHCAAAAALGALLFAASPAAAQGVNVTTYHYDNLRTGWNSQETTLTATNVAGGTFGILATFPLGRADGSPVNAQAQPLIVTGLNIPGQGVHNVLYVATEANILYMLDASTGAVLNSRSFGNPIPPYGEPGLATPVGIELTPVIDIARGAIYLINTFAPVSGISLQLHKINLTTLQDMVTPVTVAGTHMLVNGTVINFIANAQRQRPALLESNGTIYAAFGSLWRFEGADLPRLAARLERGFAPAAAGEHNHELARDLDRQLHLRPHRRAVLSQLDLDVGLWARRRCVRQCVLLHGKFRPGDL